jgi:hypothetical protein
MPSLALTSHNMHTQLTNPSIQTVGFLQLLVIVTGQLKPHTALKAGPALQQTKSNKPPTDAPLHSIQADLGFSNMPQLNKPLYNNTHPHQSYACSCANTMRPCGGNPSHKHEMPFSFKPTLGSISPMAQFASVPAVSRVALNPRGPHPAPCPAACP